MATTNTTKHDQGDGTHTKETTTTYPSGATKTVETDITDTTLVSVDPVVSVTRTDADGNSKTRIVS